MSGKRQQQDEQPEETIDGLTPRQNKALQALVKHGTVAEAARASKIGASTIWSYLKDVPAFKDRAEQAQRQALADAVASLTSSSSSAVGVLTGIMNDETAAGSVRVSAASKILDFGLKLRESWQYEERLAMIEETMARQGAARKKRDA